MKLKDYKVSTFKIGSETFTFEGVDPVGQAVHKYFSVVDSQKKAYEKALNLAKENGTNVPAKPKSLGFIAVFELKRRQNVATYAGMFERYMQNHPETCRNLLNSENCVLYAVDYKQTGTIVELTILRESA